MLRKSDNSIIPEWVTPAQYARLHKGTKQSTVYTWIRSGRIDARVILGVQMIRSDAKPGKATPGTYTRHRCPRKVTGSLD